MDLMETKQYRNTIKSGAYFVSDVSIHSFHVFFFKFCDT